MSDSFIARAEITIQQPNPVVWDALTNPETFKQWFFGVDLKTNWKAGAPIIFSGSWQGQSFEDKGTVLEVDPNRKILYNYYSNFSGLPDEPEYYQKVCYKLEDTAEGTLLQVSQDNLQDEERRQRVENDWKSILEALKKLIEK
ncbi:MAG: SRPBCC domain-containing protein [Bacteroidetes bacterium]|nr:SRPBCC domain-containing protein [Bacteroidota bacterium]